MISYLSRIIINPLFSNNLTNISLLPQFNDHILQAKSNFSFLGVINKSAPNHYDWQVTVCFYTALHLVNAHLSKFNQQYRNHKDVNYALSPYNVASPMKIPENVYTSYEALFSLSRRARYLINMKDDNLGSDTPFFTNERHLSKSIRHLELLFDYFDTLYGIGFTKIPLKCTLVTNKNAFRFFDIS